MPIKGAFYPSVYGFLNCSGKAWPFPAHNANIFNVVGWFVVDHWPYMGEGPFRFSLDLS